MSEGARSKCQPIPLSTPNFGPRELELVSRAVTSEWVSTAGAFITELEAKIASFVGAKYAVACQSGTAGLHVGLICAGVTRGDEVLVPTLTFIAPVNAIRYVGAEPTFFDCDASLGIDVAKLERFLDGETKRTGAGLVNAKTGRPIRAIMPVHIFGNSVDMVALLALAKRFDLPVIEDASESLGTRFTGGPLKGTASGTHGRLGVYSFNGNKIITTGGGGMLVTNDDKIAKHAKYLTTQAKDDEVAYVHNEVGYNYRLTNLQAALGLAQLERLEDFIATKKANLGRYEAGLSGLRGLRLLPFRADTRSNRWFYSVYLDDECPIGRDALIDGLGKESIQARPIWVLNHRQKPYRENQAFDIERASHYWERVVNIPCSTNLKPEDLDRVVDVIRRLHREHAASGRGARSSGPRTEANTV